MLQIKGATEKTGLTRKMNWMKYLLFSYRETVRPRGAVDVRGGAVDGEGGGLQADMAGNLKEGLDDLSWTLNDCCDCYNIEVTHALSSKLM